MYWEMLQNYHTENSTFILLTQSVDNDLDNELECMSSWEFISSGLLNNQYIWLLYEVRFFKLIGHLASNKLFQHICFAYVTVQDYIEGHLRADEQF